MQVGDRARMLIAQGADPRAAAGQTVVSPRYRRMAARDLRIRAAIFLGGVSMTVIIGGLTGYHRSPPAETVRQHQLAEAGLGPDQVLPADIQARLAIAPHDVATVAELLRIPVQADLDLAWQTGLDNGSTSPIALPSRTEALRDFLDTMARLGPAERQAVMTQIAITAALTPMARDLVQELQTVPENERSQVIPLLASIMRLPLDQRQTLEKAGYPAVPADTERQDLYKRLSHVTAEQGGLVFTLLSDPRRGHSLARVDQLLLSQPIRRILGAVADGTLAITDHHDLPFRCDIAVAGSCRKTP